MDSICYSFQCSRSCENSSGRECLDCSSYGCCSACIFSNLEDFPDVGELPETCIFHENF